MISNIKFQHKRLPLVCLFILTVFFKGFAQEETLIQKDEATKQNDTNFFFTLSPLLYINTDSSSAPSPISFSAGLGFDFFNSKKIGMECKANFFTNYFLWDGKIARPAEIENRTALVFNSLWDIDATYAWNFTTSQLKLCAGLGFLLRYAILANGIDESDDVKDINKSFYSKLNFLYPNLGLSWLYDFNARWKAGFEAKLYLPVGAIAEGRGLDSMMISAGVKALLK